MIRAALIAIAVGLGLLMSSKPVLRYFKADEFGEWFDVMSPELLTRLDNFRDEWGYPVEVSSAVGAIGRHDHSDSQHNVSKHGEVRAIDIFPKVPLLDGSGYRYMQTAGERRRALEVAKKVGFRGIGLYTDTRQGNLLHVDVRQTQALATWSRIDGDYRSINEVLV